MKVARALYSLLFVFVLASWAAAANCPPPSGTPAVDNGKYALLIGINDYKYAPPLRGAVADVDFFYDLLQKKAFSFDKNNINPIKNGDSKCIIDGFEWLVNKAKNYKKANPGKEATVFFLYSGHGSQVPVPAGVPKPDETDGYDESIVPVDSRDPEGKNFDIIDDVIASFIAAVGAATKNATFVFDSCHSGTVDRGEGTPREIPPDKRKQPKVELPPGFPSVSATSANAEARDLVRDSNGDYVLISGSTSEELSREKAIDGDPSHGIPTSYRGALSFYLGNELERVNSETTYRELMDRVAAEVNNDFVGQHPQLSGVVNRKIFDGAVSNVPRRITVIDADDRATTATITEGRFGGISEGTLVAFYDESLIDPKERDDPRGTTGKLGEGTVTAADLNRSVVSFTPVQGRTVSKAQLLGKRVVLLSPLFNGRAVRVLLPTAPGDTVIADLKSRLSADATAPGRGLFDLSPVDRKKGLDDPVASVRKDPFREAFCGGLPKTAKRAECDAKLPEPPLAADGKTPLGQTPDTEMVYYITQKNGDPLFDFYVKEKDPRAAEKIQSALVKYARQKNLLGLENRGSLLAKTPRGGKPPVQVDLLQITGTSDDKGFHVNTTKTLSLPALKPDHELHVRDYYRLKVTNNSTDELYVTVLNISTDGAINAMWPKVAQEKLLPGASIETKLYVISPPFGVEEFKVIATKEYSDYSGFGQGAVTRDVRGSSNPLNQLMEQAASGATRGGWYPDSDSWAVISPFKIKVVK